MTDRARLVATCHAPGVDGLLRSVGRARALLEVALGAPPRAAGQGARALIEVRLDLLDATPSDEAVGALGEAAGGSLLLTLRPAAPESRDRRARRLGELGRWARIAQAAAVDVEHEAGDVSSPRRSLGALPEACEVVLSLHAEGAAAARVAASSMVQREADVLKLAWPASSASSDVDVIDALRGATQGKALAPVPTGPAGTWARLLAGRGLSALCYVTADAALPGPDLGQPMLEDALDAHAVHRVGPSTAAFAVLGWPLGATWSPALHARLLRRRVVDAAFVALPVREPAEALAVLSRLRLDGAAVTAPHKMAFRAQPGFALSESASVRACGSLNTLRRGARDVWEAESFDGAAARRVLERLGPLRGRRIVVLGAGGAARSLLASLRGTGADTVVLARRVEAARAAAAEHDARWGGLDRLESEQADVVVNATPVGSDPHHDAVPAPVSASGGAALFDMVTTPPDTRWLREGRLRGVPTLDGLAMLADQAAAQQRWWLGSDGAPTPEEAEACLRTLVDRAAGRGRTW